MLAIWISWNCRSVMVNWSCALSTQGLHIHQQSNLKFSSQNCVMYARLEYSLSVDVAQSNHSVMVQWSCPLSTQGLYNHQQSNLKIPWQNFVMHARLEYSLNVDAAQSNRCAGESVERSWLLEIYILTKNSKFENLVESNQLHPKCKPVAFEPGTQ